MHTLIVRDLDRRNSTTEFDEGRELVRRWRASGKNQSEFCRAEGISQQRLHYWRQRVTDGDLEPPKPTSSFVVVQVRPPAPGAGVEVVLRNGRVKKRCPRPESS